MQSLLILVCLAVGGWQDDEPAKIEERIRRREEKLEELDRKIQEALQEKRYGEAAQLNREYSDTREELERLRAELETAKARVPARRYEWYDSFNLLGGAQGTRFDSSLDLEDGVGWNVGIAFKNFFSFEFRRWEVEDERTDGDAVVNEYLFAFTPNFRVDGLGDSTFGLGIQMGVFHIGSDGSGGDSDTGLMTSISPRWGYYASEWLRVTVGVDFDLLRTHFNSHSTNSEWNVGLHAGLEIAF